MEQANSVITEDTFQTCDSPSGSSTSEPHDDAILNLQQNALVDHSLFHKLDQFTSNNTPSFFMQQQQQQQQLQQQQQQQQYTSISPSLSPPLSLSSPSNTMTSFVDPLLPNNSENMNPNFWSGFNNANLEKSFTEYLSGYSTPQQHLFPNSQSTQSLDELNINQDSTTIPKSVTSIPGMQIRVLGVPQTGAKSRVETQIKLCIQLVTDDGDKAQWWSHLKLPENMVAKDKLKRQILLSTAPNGSKITSVAGFDSNSAIQSEKMLFLSARVICASDPSRKVLTCLGCIQRERKRSQRRKENKFKLESEDDKRKFLEDEKSLAAEEQKILLFNCSELVDFSSGDTILPTRITCYCRHHNERVGFCIYFEMHDHTGKQVATGMSPPIMITDDHKSNKIKTGRKRLRTNDSTVKSTALISPYDSRPGSSSSLHYSNTVPQQYPIQPRPPSMLNRTSVSSLDSPSTFTTQDIKQHATPAAISPVPSTTQLERPLIQRLIPNEGPTYGGVEVTILGSGFTNGLTCMFGDVAASSTHFWSPNTLVCILPPATSPGTVVVSFKEHPLVVESQDVSLFTYYNENDRALMELALQVVGLKMTGKVEDAREIAMRIVQGGNNNNGNSTNQQQPQQQQMSMEHQVIKIIEVMRTFRNVQSADVSMTTGQGHTMLHLACMLGFHRLSQVLLDLEIQVDIVDRNGYTALHYAVLFNHEKLVSLLLNQGNADPEISNRWNQKPTHLTNNSSIQHQLRYHHPSIQEIDSETEDGYSSSDMMSADIDTSYTEDEDSVWLSDADSVVDNSTWLTHPTYDALSDSETDSSSVEEEHHPIMIESSLRRRHRRNHYHSRQETAYAPTIQYLNEEESTSHSTDEIMDAQPLHEVLHDDTDYEEDAAKEMTWMQRTLSHFQQPTDVLQNIKNNIQPSELNLKTIADHLLQFPRPTMIVANMFGAEEDRDNKVASREEPSEQALAWYMALAYAMGAKSLTAEEEAQQPSPVETDEQEVAMTKRRDKRLFSFWVPLLCLMVLWLIFQFISSNPSVVDTLIGISGFRRQYLSVH